MSAKLKWQQAVHWQRMHRAALQMLAGARPVLSAMRGLGCTSGSERASR